MQRNSVPLNIVQRLQQAQLRLAAIALLALMLITCADVFMRYLFNRPIRGSYELVECMMLVFVFHGMAAAFFGRRNIVIDLVDTFVSARGGVSDPHVRRAVGGVPRPDLLGDDRSDAAGLRLQRHQD